MREETKYIADDGTVFEDREKALEHDSREQFKTWYKTDPMLGAADAPVPLANLFAWLRKNRITVLHVLRALQK